LNKLNERERMEYEQYEREMREIEDCMRKEMSNIY
jgi:hypothetical protein